MICYHTSEKEAFEVVSQIETWGGKAIAIGQDLRNPLGLDSLIRRSEEALGPIDGLINCAAIFKKDSSSNNQQKLLSEHLAINATVPLILSEMFADAFTQSHDDFATGAIINLIDSRIDCPSDGYRAYYTSKQVLYNHTKSLALSLAPRVRVNGISPGAIIPLENRDESYFEKMSKILPLRRTGSVEDIVMATQFLLVEEFITGEVLKIDGGGHLL